MTRKIIIAPDSFKGSLAAEAVAMAIAEGLTETLPAGCAEIILLPVADGGEGTLDAMVARDAWKFARVSDPIGRTVSAAFGLRDSCAVIEMARAAGLTLLAEEQRHATVTTTYGVGELIRAALDAGATELLLTAGGSATNDGGCGMMAALGVRFLNDHGEPFLPTGGTLKAIRTIDTAGLDPRLLRCRITVATDVRNPLLGADGATAVYAPQKGASPEELTNMECGMAHLAAHWEKKTGTRAADLPGCGAAGGLSLPLLSLGAAKICSGIDAVLCAVGFDRALENAALVITGEGRIDRQSLCGKAVGGVARRAAARGVPVDAFVGCVGDDLALLRSLGLRQILSLESLAVSPTDSMHRARELLRTLAVRYAGTLAGEWQIAK